MKHSSIIVCSIGLMIPALAGIENASPAHAADVPAYLKPIVGTETRLVESTAPGIAGRNFAGAGAAPSFAGRGFVGRGFGRGFHGRGFARGFGVPAFGLGLGYGAYGYYDDNACYAWTPYGYTGFAVTTTES